MTGAVLTVVGFAAASRARPAISHSPRQRAQLSILSAIAGAALGAALLGALVMLSGAEPAIRARFAERLAEPLWRPWALGFESAILEEIVFRLFTMSVIAWLASRLVRSVRAPLVIALSASTLFFGLAHLPAWLAATHATPALIAGVLVLNGAGGALFGFVFWRWGVPYAIGCHLLADVVVQGLAPRLLT